MANSCLLLTNPKCILPVSDQKESNLCYGLIVIATFYGKEEVVRTRFTQEGTLLKLMDHIHWFKHHQCVAPMGPFNVSHDGFGGDHEKFIYVKRYCPCLKTIYPWVGCRNISKALMCDRNKGK